MLDGRANGNNRRLTVEAQNFLIGFHAANQDVKLADCQTALVNHHGVCVDRATLSRFFNANHISIQKLKSPKIQAFDISYGGLEIIAALACKLKWPDATARQIQQATSLLERIPGRNPSPSLRNEWRGRNARGQFTASYNQRRDVRSQRFAAIEDKRQNKDLLRLQLCQSGFDTLTRKALAMVALPIITLNGTLRSVNTPMGNALKDFAGYNYKDATLDKFLRELKYLGIAESLLRHQVTFWQKQWREAGLDLKSQQSPLLCYYIDGNTKALWSSKRVLKNKVTMLGRVMGCLEQVFVHDALGRPTYFETYSGRAPWGEYVLSLFDKIEKTLEQPATKWRVIRLLVLDGANNSVKTLRAFAAQDKYYFITTLDKNQWQPRRVRHEGAKRRYENGNAFVSDCEIELVDSTDKGYLITVRAIKIEWDDGKLTVLLTNLPIKILDAGGVAKTYFDRWPLQELWFRDTKEFAALHRVAGYGKKLLDDRTVQSKQKELQSKIEALRIQLQHPLAELDALDQQLHFWIDKERQIRDRTLILKGLRQMSSRQAKELDECQSAIASIERRKHKIRNPHQKWFDRLKRYEHEWLGLRGKEKVYRADVVLDQILTYFRVAFVNLCTYFQMNFFRPSGAAQTPLSHMSLATMLHRIFSLPATVEQTQKDRRIYLKRNLKDKETMALLEDVLPRLNRLNLRHATGRRVEFYLK